MGDSGYVFDIGGGVSVLFVITGFAGLLPVVLAYS
jgi:hypothetical protein